MIPVQEMPLIRSIMSAAEDKIKTMTGLDVQLEIKVQCVPVDSAEVLIDKCVKLWGVDADYIRKRSRDQSRVVMRKVLCLLIKSRTKMTLREIGERLGHLDHTSVIHNVQSCVDLLAVKDQLLLEYYEPVKHLFSDEVEA